MKYVWCSEYISDYAKNPNSTGGSDAQMEQAEKDARIELYARQVEEIERAAGRRIITDVAGSKSDEKRPIECILPPSSIFPGLVIGRFDSVTNAAKAIRKRSHTKRRVDSVSSHLRTCIRRNGTVNGLKWRDAS